MTKMESEAITMLKKLLEVDKSYETPTMNAILLGYCVGIMTLMEPDSLEPTVRSCIGTTYLACNEDVAEEMGIDDFIEYVLEFEA